MLNKGSDDTKTKIMEAAFELFGRFGFAGTSIRKISDQSGVNLAAINYHFKTKENLFWEIMVSTYVELEHEIQKFSVESKDTKDLAMKVFQYFLKEKFALTNAMKMMLSQNLTVPLDSEVSKVLNNPMGPPGGIYFAEMIQKDISYELSREGVLWGIKSIFGAVFHWSIMCCTHCLDETNTDPLMSEDQISKDVERMVESALTFLKMNPEKFKSGKSQSR